MLLCGGCFTTAAFPNGAIPVEIRTGGDDGLTLRLAEAVRNELRQSIQFTLAPGSTQSSLTISIPTHVAWDNVDGRTRVTYALSLDSAERNLGKSGGVCWEDDLRTCARQIVLEAARAISK